MDRTKHSLPETSVDAAAWIENAAEVVMDEFYTYITIV